jgi:flagellar basal-body rod modification protein FlgD
MSTVSNVTAATSAPSSTSSTTTNPNATLSQDAFMQLLLTEMQNQDPTAPMDSGKILQQTSELATLESSNKTNTTLTKLSSTLQSSQQFSAIPAIGKLASLASGNTITADGSGSPQNLDLYFPTAASSGDINITDQSGNIVDTISIKATAAGTSSYAWDGKNSAGKAVPAGTYHVNASYIDSSGKVQTTTLGTYPVSAVAFNGSSTTVKLGSNYYPLSNIKEVY